MAHWVNRIVTLAFVALLPACAGLRTQAVKDTSKTFSTVVVDAGHGGKDSGVHTANYRVLRNATYPAVLVECGYLSNRSEGNQARDSEYRELVADRIAAAIVEQRYGAGVYHSSTQVAAGPPLSATPTGGTGLAPGAPHR